MTLGVVEVARLGQMDEGVDGAGGLAVEQVERDLAEVGVDRGLVTGRVVRRGRREAHLACRRRCRRVAAVMRRLGHGRRGGGGRGGRRLRCRGRRVLGAPAGEEQHEQGGDQRRGEHRADPDQPALAHLALPGKPLLLLAAVPFPGYPALALVLTRHRLRPPWPVALSGYRWYSREAGPRTRCIPLIANHGQRRSGRATSRTPAIFAIVRESYLPDARTGTLR